MLASLAFLFGICANAFAPPHWEVREGKPTEICYNETWGTAGIVPSPYKTCVSVTAHSHGFSFEFHAENDRVQLNAYEECNSDMFNQEVVELFITNDTVSEKPEHYYEIELTPSKGVWFGYDSNPGGERTNLSHGSLDCDQLYTWSHIEADRWEAGLQLPFSLIGRTRRYRVAFFRVQMHEEQWRRVAKTDKTPCGTNNCSFICANCPTTAEPDFHQSGFFGYLDVVH
jgi:hypothetical protein